MPSHHIRIIEIFASILVCAAFLRWSYRRNYSECKGNAYEFDPGRIPGAFEPHAKRYQALAKLVLTLAAASAAFLLSFLANIDVSKARNYYSIRLEYVAPSAMVFLCLSAGACLIFLLLQNICYEQYTHVVYPTKEGVTPKPSPYSDKRYATVLMCAEASILFFALAHIVIGVSLLI
jgi:hypothetical protein